MSIQFEPCASCDHDPIKDGCCCEKYFEWHAAQGKILMGKLPFKTEKYLSQGTESTELIKKYGNWYIRIYMGAHGPMPCDLAITEAEAMRILNAKDPYGMMLDIQHQTTDYVKLSKGIADRQYFKELMIKDYLINVEGLSQKRIDDTIKQLNKDQTLLSEFYWTLANERFSKRPRKVEGYTAEILYLNTHVPLSDAYLYLICLTDFPEETLEVIKFDEALWPFFAKKLQDKEENEE